MLKALYSRFRQRLAIREAVRDGRLVLGKGVTFGSDFGLKLHGTARPQLEVGDRSHLAGRFVVRGEGSIRIGRDCHFHENSYFGALRAIRIGDSVFAAEGIFVVDNNNHPVAPESRRAMTLTPMGGPLWLWTAPGVDAAPVTIEDNVWIGRNSSVLKGVKIGEGGIVALGAVVTKSVPQFSVVAGNPARIVKSLSSTGSTSEAAEHSSSAGQDRAIA